MCYHAANSDNLSPTFRDNLSVPSSRVKKLLSSWPLKVESTGCPETSATDYHYTLRDNPEERSSHLLGGESQKSRNDFLTSQNLTTVLKVLVTSHKYINPLNSKLNPICHLLALLGAHYIFHVSGLRVKRNNHMELEECNETK